LGVLLVAALAAGCGGQVKVSGRVLYDGQPLPGGWVTFRPADSRQNAVSAQIDPQGKYEAVLPAGDVEACVDNRDLEPAPPGGAPTMPPELLKAIQNAGGQLPSTPTDAPPKERPAQAGTYVQIPDRYYTVENSGLKFTVSSASKDHDIVLTK
jgi:hypothetical protein